MVVSFLFEYIFGFVILFAYIIYIICKDKKIPYSISSTIYSLDERNKWLYTIITFLAAFFIMPYLFEMASLTSLEPLAFLTVLGMLGTGADPLINGEKNIIHYACAIILGLASQAIVCSLYPYAMFLWLPYIIYTLYMDDGRWNMFFGEVIMMIELLVCGIIIG